MGHTYSKVGHACTLDVSWAGARLIGFDTGHPAIIITYRVDDIVDLKVNQRCGNASQIPHCGGVFAEYFPLGGKYCTDDGQTYPVFGGPLDAAGNSQPDDRTVSAIRAVLDAFGLSSRVLDTDRPLTDLLNFCLRTTPSSVVKARLRIEIGEAACHRGARTFTRRYPKHVWGDDAVSSAACAVARAYGLNSAVGIERIIRSHVG